MKKLFIYTAIILLIAGAGILQAQEWEEEPAYISYLVGSVDVDITPDNQVEDFEPAELDMDLPPGLKLEVMVFVKLPCLRGAPLRFPAALFFR